MLADLALYLAGGACAGLIAGLFGVGGGTILVPVLLMLFAQQGMPETHLMHMAVGTSHSVIIVNAISSMRAHHLRGSVLWPLFWRIVPGVILGTWIGAWAADRMGSDTLILVFGLFLLAVGLQMLIGRQPKPHRTVPGAGGLAGVGGIIGTISALVGIGGGSMTVPYLLWCNVAIPKAVGTASAVGLPIALSSTVGFIVAGLDAPALPAPSLGFVYLPAFVGLAVAGVLFAPLGARLAHNLPAARLKQGFGIFLLLVALRLLSGFL